MTEAAAANGSALSSESKIYVAGHRGLAGSAIVRKLVSEGHDNILFRTSNELDLREQAAVREFFEEERPEYVFMAAAKVGGILANDTYPAQFLQDNLLMQSNVIDAAYRSGAKKLLFLGSSCIYPKLAPQPLREEYLLTGPLEPTNEWYAVAKIAGIKLVEAYRKEYGFNAISVMPTNLYGPGDNFDLQNSHVLPALLRKVHEAKRDGAPEVSVWGTGSPKREFLHVDDLASASLFLMHSHDCSEFLNVGVGEDLSISELVQMIREIVGYEGAVVYDTSKPDGTPRKLLDVSRLNGLGWQAKIGLREGIEATYNWYLSQEAILE